MEHAGGSVGETFIVVDCITHMAGLDATFSYKEFAVIFKGKLWWSLNNRNADSPLEGHADIIE